MSGTFIVKSAITSYLLTALSFPLAYLIRILYSQTLSLEQFGSFFAAVAFVTLIATFNDLGMSESLAYFIARTEKKDHAKFFFTALTTQTITGLLIAGALVVAAEPIAQLLFDTSDTFMIQALAIYFLAFNTSVTIGGFAAGHQKTSIYRSTQAVRLTVIAILSGIAALIAPSPGLYAIVWGFSLIIVDVIYVLLIFKLLKSSPNWKLFDRRIFSRMISYSLPAIFAAAATSIMANSDLIMISSIAGAYQAGIYSATLPTAKLLEAIIVPLSIITIPYVSAEIHAGRRKEITTYVQRSLKLGAIILVPAAITIIIFASDILNILFGNRFIEAGTPLQILAVAFTVGGLVSFLFSVIMGLGKTVQRLAIVVPALAVNIVLNITLIGPYGAAGAATATLASQLILLFGSIHIIKKELDVDLQLRTLLGIAIASTAFAACLILIHESLSGAALLWHAGAIMVALVSYAVLILLTRTIRLTEIQDIISMFRTIARERNEIRGDDRQ